MGPKAENKSYLFMTVLVIKCHIIIFKFKVLTVRTLTLYSVYSVDTDVKGKKILSVKDKCKSTHSTPLLK